jgi:hypothetical protein
MTRPDDHRIPPATATEQRQAEDARPVKVPFEDTDRLMDEWLERNPPGRIEKQVEEFQKWRMDTGICEYFTACGMCEGDAPGCRRKKGHGWIQEDRHAVVDLATGREK